MSTAVVYNSVIKAFTEAASIIQMGGGKGNLSAENAHTQRSVTNLQWVVDSLKLTVQTPAK